MTCQTHPRCEEPRIRYTNCSIPTAVHQQRMTSRTLQLALHGSSSSTLTCWLLPPSQGCLAANSWTYVTPWWWSLWILLGVCGGGGGGGEAEGEGGCPGGGSC